MGELSSLSVCFLSMSIREIDSPTRGDFGSSGLTPALKVFVESAKKILRPQQPLEIWPLLVFPFS